MKNTSDPLTPQKHCSVCLKKNNKIGIKCTSCKQNVHKKCSRLKHSEILDLANCNPNFECMSSLTDQFPFVFQDNIDIQKHCLNSNFLCRFQKTFKFSNSDKNNENSIIGFNVHSNFDFLALSETWTKTNDKTGYICYSCLPNFS